MGAISCQDTRAYSSQKPPTTSIAASHGESSSSTIRSRRQSSFRPSGKYATFLIRQVAELRWIDQGIPRSPLVEGTLTISTRSYLHSVTQSRGASTTVHLKTIGSGLRLRTSAGCSSTTRGTPSKTFAPRFAGGCTFKHESSLRRLAPPGMGFVPRKSPGSFRTTRRRLHAGPVSDSASSSRIDPSASVSTTSIVKSHGLCATIQGCYEC